MRLCVMANWHSIHARRWVRYFVERGHEVHAVCLRVPGVPLEGVRLHALTGGRAEPPRAEAPLRRPREPLARGHLPAGCSMLRRAAQWLRAGLRARIRRLDPHLVVGHFLSEEGFYAAASGVRPLALCSWGSDLLLHPDQGRLSNMLIRWTLRQADIVQVMSRPMADRCRQWRLPAASIVEANFGVEDGWLELNPPQHVETAPILFSCRMLSAVYDVGTLLRSVARLGAERPDARVRLAGDGPLRPSLEQLVDDLGLRPRVEFLGLLSEEQLRHEMAGAHVYVSTAVSDGTSVSLLQAMAAGLMPVVSDIPANRAWITDGENGLLAPPTDVEAWTRQLSRALTDEPLRVRARTRNKELVRARGLWRAQLGRVEEAFERLLAERDMSA